MLKATWKKYQSIPNEWFPIAESFAAAIPASSEIKIHFTASNLFFSHEKLQKVIANNCSLCRQHEVSQKFNLQKPRLVVTVLACHAILNANKQDFFPNLFLRKTNDGDPVYSQSNLFSSLAIVLGLLPSCASEIAFTAINPYFYCLPCVSDLQSNLFPSSWHCYAFTFLSHFMPKESLLGLTVTIFCGRYCETTRLWEATPRCRQHYFQLFRVFFNYDFTLGLGLKDCDYWVM